MKLVMIASGLGGSAKTTTAVRLAETLTALRVPAGVVDLSPYPTAGSLVVANGVPVAGGRGASTPITARSVLKPYEDRLKVMFVDTGRLDDPALVPWTTLCDGLLLTTRGDRFSLAALEGLGPSLQKVRALNPDMEFLGFLPVMVSPNDSAAVDDLKRAAAKYLLPVVVPADAWEWRRSHAGCIEGLETAPAAGQPEPPADRAHRDLARFVMTKFALEPETEAVMAAAAAPKETGLVSRLWKLAGKALGPKATVTAEARP